MATYGQILYGAGYYGQGLNETTLPPRTAAVTVPVRTTALTLATPTVDTRTVTLTLPER